MAPVYSEGSRFPHLVIWYDSTDGEKIPYGLNGSTDWERIIAGMQIIPRSDKTPLINFANKLSISHHQFEYRRNITNISLFLQ